MVPLNEMQLEIIIDHYVAFTTMTLPPIQSDNKKLKEIDVNDYQSNYEELVKLKLIDTKIFFMGFGARIYISGGGITVKGIKLVKTLINSA